MSKTLDKVLLREASAAEAPIILALIHSAFEEYRGRLDPPSGAHGETEETIRRRMASARVVLALSGEEPIGCVFYEREEDFLSLSRLAVLPAYRRRGIGRALVDYVEKRARALGLGHVRLGVRLALEPLRIYYERLGYRQVQYGTHDGYSQPTYVILEKAVDAEHYPTES